jgi:hypothetical protein
VVVLALLLAVRQAYAEDISAALQLSGTGEEKVAASLEALLKARKVEAKRSAGDLGWSCMAATELAQLGESRSAGKVRAIAAQLTRDLVWSASGTPQGWGKSSADKRCPRGGYDAFGDGTCNPNDTVYAFQTGLGIACLARASLILNDPVLMKTAQGVFSSWQPLAIKGPCPHCIYFPISNSPNDADRYVRNMNVFMAFGAATLGSITGNSDILAMARRTMDSELEEYRRGNRGYLGVRDPQWIKSKGEADRIENHAASVALISKEIGILLSSEEYGNYAHSAWHTWAACNNGRCRNSDCKYWAADPSRCQTTQTATHCAFRLTDDRANQLCQSYLGKVPAVGSFGLWSLLAGRSSSSTGGELNGTSQLRSPTLSREK